MYQFTPQTLLGLVQTRGVVECVKATVPDDARIIGATYIAELGVFSVLVESATFDHVPFGKLIPCAEDALFSLKDR